MTIQEILKSLKTNELLLKSLPIGYTPGLPMVGGTKENPCFIVPFLRYRMTGKVDQTQVFPPRFVVSVAAKDGSVAAFADLRFDTRFAKIDFDKPVGTFRHAAIRHLNKQEYGEKRRQLYGVLDCLSASMQGKEEFDEMDAAKLKALFGMLIEPAVKPFYHAINPHFYETRL